jgi:hypothetical protein
MQWEFLNCAPENSMCVGLDNEYTKECEAEEPSAREEATRRHPTTLYGVRDFGIPDMPRGCSAEAPKGVPEQ